MRDDGLGVRAVERLRERGVPGDVEVIDAGTALMDVLPYLGDAEKVVLVDAVRTGGEPAAIYRLPLGELEKRMNRPGPKCSLHEVELLEALELARLENVTLDNAVVIAMEPARVEPGMGLSEQVERAMPRLLETIENEIGCTKE